MNPPNLSFGVTVPKKIHVPTQPEPDMQKFVKPHFFEDHSGKKARVPVYSVTVGLFGSKFKMICYSIPKIAVDFDGAPDAYAPPVSATNHHPRNGLRAKDDIRNGTNESAAVFHADGKGNTFHWTGVVNRSKSSAPGGDQDLDDRPFLRDVEGHFPVIEQSGPYAGFYKPKSTKSTRGEQVNAGNTCTASCPTVWSRQA